MTSIKTTDREMSVEEISWKYLETLYPDDRERAAELLRTGYVESVYSNNPGLAGNGQLIAVGTRIDMPEPASELRILRPNRLWG